VVVVVEGVRVHGVFLAGANGMDLVDQRGEVFGKGCEAVRRSVDGRNRYTCFVEETARCA
jgi:hypothetical protein